MATQKQLKNRENMALLFYILFIIFLCSTIVLIVNLVDVKNNCEKENIKQIKWDCPVLLESGTYQFMENGSLITPSGKELKCKGISDKY